jgi:enamine deaminase RidA (YjgF/YER057c/UK114 family)
MAIQRQLTNERMSQIVTHNGTVYLSGQVGDDMNAGVEQQTRETLANIEHLLDLAGTDKSIASCRSPSTSRTSMPILPA